MTDITAQAFREAAQRLRDRAMCGCEVYQTCDKCRDEALFLAAAEQREALDEAELERLAYRSLWSSYKSTLRRVCEQVGLDVDTELMKEPVVHSVQGGEPQELRLMREQIATLQAKLAQVHDWMTSDDGLDRLIAIMKDTAAWRTER